MAVVAARAQDTEASATAAGSDGEPGLNENAPLEPANSKGFLRRAHELAGIGTYQIDLNHRTMHMSPEMGRLLGTETLTLSLDDFRNTFHHPDDRAAAQAKADETYASAAALQFDMRLVRADAQPIWVRVCSNVEHDAHGAPIAVGVVKDVTELRLAMHQLEEQAAELEHLSERLQLATTAARVGIWDWDVVSDRLVWDGAMCRLYGIDPSEFRGSYEAWTSALSPTDRERVDANVRRALSGGDGFDDQFEVSLPDGSTRAIQTEARVIRDAAGRATRIVGVNYDVTERRRAEQKLKSSEARFRAFTDNALAGTYVVQRGHVSYANPALERILGYESGGLIGMNPRDLVVPEDRAMVAEGFRRSMAGELQALPHELRAIRKDGSIVSLEMLGTVIEIDGERAIFGQTLDITARKDAQRALEQSESRFRGLIEQAPVAIGMSRHGVGVYANRKFLELWGYDSAGDMVGHSVAKQWAPEFAAQIEEWARKRTQGIPTPLDYTAVAVRKDGTRFPAHAEIGKVELPDGTASIGFMTDITEARRAEEALRESERRFREIAESIDEVFWITDPAQDRFLYVSPAYAKIWGRPPPDELYASLGSWLANVHAQDRERIRAAAARQVLGGYDETYRIVRPDGSARWIRERAFPLHQSDGKVYRVVGTASDITEQRSLEIQLLHAQKMEAIGVLAGGVAHDFNNILSVILSYASLLIDEMSSLEPMRQDVQEIQVAAERAVGLTRQLLAFSRQQVFQPRVVDLDAVVSRTENMLRRLIGEDVRLHTVLHPGVHALVDAGQIEQVLLNLVVNARDAMPNGGSVTIEIGQTDLSETEAARFGLVPGVHATISVADTGVGIDPETQARIFEPFFTTKEAGKGTGLGLATVFGIVKQSRGHIAVESELGRGSTFRILLPSATPSDAEMPASRGSIELGGSETILVVEDDESVRKLVRTILAKRGYRILEAQSTDDALLLCERYAGTIHLVLTDVIMPVMNGMQLFARLSQLRPELRVLYMSGYPERSASPKSSEPPPDFLPKPFSPERLLRRVREILAGTS